MKICSFPIKRLRDRESKSINTVYQAPCDGFVSFNTEMGNQGNVFLYCETGDATPDIEIAEVHSDAGNVDIPCCKPIKKGDYWSITYAGGGTIDLIFWQPFK